MADIAKRPHEAMNGDSELAVAKRPRTEPAGGKGELAVQGPQGPKRSSGLLAPTMLLTGHAADVFSCSFSPDGMVLASGSHDKHVYLWRVYGECENYMAVSGHKNAVLEVHWTSDGDRIVSASADRSVRAWDARTGVQVKRLAEHDNFVNSCCPLKRGPPLLCSGADDGNVKVWDLRMKRSAHTFAGTFQVLAVAFAEAGDQVYAGGLDNAIRAWDLRQTDAPAMTLQGHSDMVTGLRVSPKGTHLLSNAADNTLRIWDVRPYAPADRCEQILTGHMHSFERNLLRCDWSPDGSKVAAGSADQFVYVWRTGTRQIDYKLPGHQGSVNEAVFHPTEPILASCSSDKNIYLGELSKWS